MSQYFDCDLNNQTISGNPATKTINAQGWEVLTLGDRKCLFNENMTGASFENNEFLFFYDKDVEFHFYLQTSYSESV